MNNAEMVCLAMSDCIFVLAGVMIGFHQTALCAVAIGVALYVQNASRISMSKRERE